MKKQFSRKEISSELNIGNETLRYYEKIGIIPKPYRSSSGYRIYNEEDLFRLKFILKSKKMGFTLREISDTLHLLGKDKRFNNDILSGQIDIKINEIDEKIKELKDLKKVLECAKKNINLKDCNFLNF
jgi:MerR family transcriptional regulator, mercuric resistance operon regulatory protein